MTENIQGELSSGLLANLLEFFKQSRTAGRLTLESGLQTGYIYVEEGVITHSSHQDNVGAEALTELLNWQGGRFLFEPDAPGSLHPPEKDLSLSGSPPAAGLTETPRGTVQDEPREARSPQTEATQPAVPQAPPAPNELSLELFEALGLSLRRLVGPIGEIFLDDAAGNLGYDTEENVRAEDIPALLELVAEELADGHKRRQFLSEASTLLTRNGFGG